MSQEGPPTSSPSHEFSCPADPRWRRIHRGGCWEQDLYPLTSAVTPAVPTSLQAAAAEEGSGDCGPDRVGGPQNLRCLCTHFQGPAARHHRFLRRKFKKEQIFLCPSLPFSSLSPNSSFLPLHLSLQLCKMVC